MAERHCATRESDALLGEFHPLPRRSTTHASWKLVCCKCSTIILSWHSWGPVGLYLKAHHYQIQHQEFNLLDWPVCPCTRSDSHPSYWHSRGPVSGKRDSPTTCQYRLIQQSKFNLYHSIKHLLNCVKKTITSSFTHLASRERFPWYQLVFICSTSAQSLQCPIHVSTLQLVTAKWIKSTYMYLWKFHHDSEAIYFLYVHC